MFSFPLSPPGRRCQDSLVSCQRVQSPRARISIKQQRGSSLYVFFAYHIFLSFPHYFRSSA
ncbi:Hypothetical protein, putative [Bodo saltans]|uniref:Uncharacterized protein n=1 Tax=Bodo saltans TaxID=75058 RepID=A0A0S4JSE1_BODSA|nr:Hypothetical protein, putative [Bodo saltans]|eukprot:CUG93728.1 Hypothetical protein, putative [Bodo saltans]